VTQEVFYKHSLQKKERELEELNASLEKRVEAKTQALKELNDTLELRVQEEISKNEEKQRVMFWQSRLASLGDMLANIAHQWRQPLSELNLIIFRLKESAIKGEKEEIQNYYNESRMVIKNMSQTIEDFTNFFRPEKVKHHFRVSESINEALTLLDKIIKAEMINIRVDVEDSQVLGIANELTQVIINLIKNSKDAFCSNSILIREINIRTKEKGNFAIIEFEDNAGGIQKEYQERIFEPYFTTKHKSSGTGLGLFMSKMICEQGLDGYLDLTSRKSSTTFSIKIPLAIHHEK